MDSRLTAQPKFAGEMKDYKIPKKKPQLQSIIVIPEKQQIPPQKPKWQPKIKPTSRFGYKRYRFTPNYQSRRLWHPKHQESRSKSPSPKPCSKVNITSSAVQVSPETAEISTQTESILSSNQVPLVNPLPKNKKRKCYRCKGKHYGTLSLQEKHPIVVLSAH